jgi:hypothetical protein
MSAVGSVLVLNSIIGLSVYYVRNIGNSGIDTISYMHMASPVSIQVLFPHIMACGGVCMNSTMYYIQLRRVAKTKRHWLFHTFHIFISHYCVALLQGIFATKLDESKQGHYVFVWLFFVSGFIAVTMEAYAVFSEVDERLCRDNTLYWLSKIGPVFTIVVSAALALYGFYGFRQKPTRNELRTATKADKYIYWGEVLLMCSMIVFMFGMCLDITLYAQQIH